MILILVLLGGIVHEGLGVCDKCTPYNVKCVSSTEYQYCMYNENGSPLGNPISCPQSQICSVDKTNGSNPCQIGVSPDCTCGYCNEYGFACVSDTQLKLCFDGKTPSDPVIKCPVGRSCDFTQSSGSYCGAGSDSTCKNSELQTGTTTTTSTASPVQTTTASTKPQCTGAGSYPAPGTKCQSYYLCVFTLINWIPVQFNCGWGMLYNPSTKQCAYGYTCSE